MFSILDMDEKGLCTILFTSPAVETLLGYTPEEYLALGCVLCDGSQQLAALGKLWLRARPTEGHACRPLFMSEAVHPDDLPLVLASIAEARRDPEKTWRTVRYREARRDASWADIESTYTARGSLLFGITRDATGVQAAQRALKDILLSTSFDLRCAATSIVGASSLLRNRLAVMADSEAAFLSDAVRVSCNMLNGLASNVLELRRLERGELKVTLAPFNLRDTVHAVLQMCRMAKSTGVELVWANEAEADTSLPQLVEGDTVLTALILQNLVVNSLKFSSGCSKVEVAVVLEDTAEESTRILCVDVSDRGVGIAPEDHERIFEKYQRSAPEHGGGAGLGLHISRGFARALNGDIELVSAPGEGSTFTLRIPVRLLDAAEAAAALQHDASCETIERDVPAPALFSRVEANVAAGRHPGKDPFAECSLQEMLLTLLSEANEIFCFTSPVGEDMCPRFAYVSPCVRKILGWEPAQLIGRGCSCLIHPDDIDKHAAATSLLARASGADNCGRMMFGMRRLLRADGSYIWMHLEAYQVGNIYYALWRDATRYKESQASLKEYLLATSHDMRTPVTGIITAAQLLEQRPSVQQDGEAAFLVQAIKSCGSLMLSVLSNVLEMRNLEPEGGCTLDRSLTVVLRSEPFNPRALLAELFAATCTAVGHSASSGASISISPTLPHTVLVDVERLRRIWQNMFIALLRNSTDDRLLRINLACPVSPDDSECAELQLDLTDPARDMNACELSNQFTPYFTAQTADGLFCGLGLCVAQAFARAMGGSLSGEHLEPGAEPPGVVLRMRLPVRVVPTCAAAPPDSRVAGMLPAAEPTQMMSPRKRPSPEVDSVLQSDMPPPVAGAGAADLQPHILLVEDHALTLKLMTKLLRSSGFRVSTAVHGADALLQLKGMEALPDAILTDVQMPVMDGLQFARAFRAWEAQTRPPGTPQVPVVALSANVLDEHVQASYQAGATCHFAKPLRPDALRELRRMIDAAQPKP